MGMKGMETSESFLPHINTVKASLDPTELRNMTLASKGNHALIGPKFSSRLKIGNLGKCSEGLDEIPVE